MIQEKYRQANGQALSDLRLFAPRGLHPDPDLACESPLLVQALEIWKAARGARRMPARADVDPLSLPRELLKHMLLIDVLHEPAPRFRWRLIGTGVTRRLGRDSTGRYWDELYDGETLDWFSAGPRWVVEHRVPLRLCGQAPVEERLFLTSESIDLPLSEDGERVSMIWVVSVFS